nr:hypothetical protein [Tanacetum cinerariifolium]
MSQVFLLTVMNSMSLLGESVNVDEKRKESCNNEAELLESQNAFNSLLKRRSDQGMQHDLGVPNGPAVQTIIPNNAAFDCDDIECTSGSHRQHFQLWF